jgi:hypothetical protein
MTKRKEKKPAHVTVAELLKNVGGLPLWVRFWLERYASGDEYALETNGLHDDPATHEIARLVYAVLYTDSHPHFATIDDNLPYSRFPAEARDFIEAWMYRITNGQILAEPWNNPDMAVMALPIVLDDSAGPLIEYEANPTLAMLRTAIKSLTTKAERREFLHSTAEEDSEPEDEHATNWRAAFKCARVLADPQTPREAWWHLRDVLTDFSAFLNLDITHPALVRRAFLIMCEAKPKGKVREWRALRKRVLDALDSISEEKGDDE